MNRTTNNVSTALVIVGFLFLGLGAIAFAWQYWPAQPPEGLAMVPAASPPVINQAPTPYPTHTPYPTFTPLPTIQPTAKSLRPAASTSPGRIVIPSIGVDAPVNEVGWDVIQNNDGTLTSVWQTADFAVGYHQSSGLPGTLGNCVLSGHNNIKGEVFKDLSEVEVGDQILMHANEYEYEYKVEDAFIVQEKGASDEQRRKNAQWIAPTTDERLTLVSCWPYWTNTHRVIVVAMPVIPEDLLGGTESNE